MKKDLVLSGWHSMLWYYTTNVCHNWFRIRTLLFLQIRQYILPAWNNYHIYPISMWLVLKSFQIMESKYIGSVFLHISMIINYIYEASKHLSGSSTTISLIAYTLSSRDIMLSLFIWKPRYSKLSFDKKDFHILILKPAILSFL